MKIWWAVAVAGALASCKGDDAKTRSKKLAASDSFWPEAPKPTSTSETRTLAYKPENVRAYAIEIDVGTTSGADVRVSAKMGLAFAFEPGASPRERTALLRKLQAKIDAGSQSMEMQLDGGELVIQQGAGETVRIKRGDPGPFALADIVDKPFTTLTFTDHDVLMKSNDEHPFNRLGGDMLDTALVLFPTLPAGAIGAGHTWTMKRNVPLGNNLGRIDVTYRLEYVGDGACPSGAPSCAQLRFTAESADATVFTQGVEVKVTYGFAGKVFFDLAKGIIDESRVRMDMDVKADNMKVPMGGLFTIKPA